MCFRIRSQALTNATRCHEYSQGLSKLYVFSFYTQALSRLRARFIYETLRASCFLAAYFMRKSKCFLKPKTGSSSLGIFLEAGTKCLKATRTEISCHQAPLQCQFSIQILEKSYLGPIHLQLAIRFPTRHSNSLLGIATCNSTLQLATRHSNSLLDIPTRYSTF